MQTLQPEQAQFLLERALPTLANEHRITQSMIEAIPTDKGDYRPSDVSPAANDLAWHLASTEVFFLNAVSAGTFKGPRPTKPDWIHTSADIARWYTDNFAEALERLKQTSPEQLAKIMDFRGMFQLPAVTFIDFALHHGIHHRGQLSVYLRPMGAKVPSIYGESYDAAQARKAQNTTA